VLATENVIAYDMLEGDNTSLGVATMEDEKPEGYERVHEKLSWGITLQENVRLEI
jgi:hypothetical protein